MKDVLYRVVTNFKALLREKHFRYSFPNRTTFLSKLQPLCRLLHIILHYFLLTNYAWMLCEGFYLHTVLVSAFISEKKLVKWLIVTGWAMPAVMINIYGTLRQFCGSIEDTIQ